VPEASPFCGLRHLQEREASDMENGSDVAGVAALLGMHGFVVTGQTVRDGEVWLAVETTATRLACPSCGVFGIGNGRLRVIVRDPPIAGRATVLVWDKRIGRCREARCARSLWSETSPLIAPRASLTERARREICRRVGEDLDSVAELVREFGVGWHNAHQAVVDQGDALIDADARLEHVTALGVDEHTFSTPTLATARGWSRRSSTSTAGGSSTPFLAGPARSCGPGSVPSRSGRWADQIRVAAIDAFAGYASESAGLLRQVRVGVGTCCWARV